MKKYLHDGYADLLGIRPQIDELRELQLKLTAAVKAATAHMAQSQATAVVSNAVRYENPGIQNLAFGLDEKGLFVQGEIPLKDGEAPPEGDAPDDSEKADAAPRKRRAGVPTAPEIRERADKLGYDLSNDLPLRSGDHKLKVWADMDAFEAAP